MMVNLKRILSAIDRTERNKINENYDEIETEFSRLNRDVSNVVGVSDEVKTTASEALQLSESTQKQLDTIVISGDSSVEAAQARIGADGTQHNTLKARIDSEIGEVAQQLAQTAKKNEVVIKGNGTLDDFNETTRAVLQGLSPGQINAVLGEENVKKENLAKDSVTITKLAFAERNVDNLFNGQYTYSLGIGAGHTFVQSAEGVVAIVNVTPNTTYTVRKFDLSDRFRIGSSSVYPSSGQTLNYIWFDDSSLSTSFTVGADIKYLVIHVSSSKQEPRLNVTSGNVAEFKPYRVIDESYIAKNKSGFISGRHGRLNFNFNDARFEVSAPVALIYDGKTRILAAQNISLRTTDGLSVLYADIRTGTIGTASNDDYMQNTNRVVFATYDFVNRKIYNMQNYYINGVEPKVSIDGINSELYRLVTEGTIAHKQWYTGGLVVADGTIIAGSNRVRTDYIKVNQDQKLSFEGEGTSGMYVFVYDDNKVFKNATGYVSEYSVNESGYVRIVSKFTDERDIIPEDFIGELTVSVRTVDKSSKIKLFGNFTQYYVADESVTNNAIVGESADSLYARWDALLSSNVDIMVKKLLGYGTDENGNQDQSLPIYEYTINPPVSYLYIPLKQVPKILITSGLHGNEKSATESTLEFATQLVNNYNSNDNLASIKSNVQLKIIPIANPGGYTDLTRNNRHNVDLNRNFGHRWIEATGAKGIAPYSEFETQVLRDWLIANKDAVLYIDHHNTGEEYGISYFNTPNTKLHDVYSTTIRRCTDKWYLKYGGRRDRAHGWITNDIIPTTYNAGYYEHGIENSCILEIAWDYNGSQWTKEVFERGTEQLTNFILAFLNQLE